MALFFTFLQVMEYFGVSYTITDSVYGSAFYMGTGLILGLISFFINKNNFFEKISSQTVFGDTRIDALIVSESVNSKGISPY